MQRRGRHRDAEALGRGLGGMTPQQQMHDLSFAGRQCAQSEVVDRRIHLVMQLAISGALARPLRPSAQVLQCRRSPETTASSSQPQALQFGRREDAAAGRAHQQRDQAGLCSDTGERYATC